MKTSMTTAIGNQAVNTGTYGIRAMFSRAGLPITAGTGHGSIRGDTPGWMTRRGDLHHSTMDAGHTSAIGGVGVQGPFPEGTVDREATEVDTAFGRTTRQR
jgi:hypothetical protein